MFSVDDKTNGMAQSPDITLSNLKFIGNETRFEIYMRLQQSDSGLSGLVAYNPDLFDSATIERFIGDYQAIVESILEAPNSPVSAFV